MKSKVASVCAFTLMELLIVVVLLAVASAGMVPVFLGNTAHYRLKDSATRILDTMQFCQSMAVFEGRAFRLNIEREQNACGVSFEKNPVDEPGQFVPYNASGFSLYKLQEGVLFKGLAIDQGKPEGEEPLAEEYIEFRKDGTADRAVVVIGNETGECFSIFVSSLTGGVRVSEENYLAEETEQERIENKE